MARKKARRQRRRSPSYGSTMNYAMRGMVDMTTMGMTGVVGAGLISTTANALKK